MTKTKDLKYCSCTFSHDDKRKLLCIRLWRKGKIFYKTNILGVTKRFVNKFIKGFDDNQAREINSLEMENI